MYYNDEYFVKYYNDPEFAQLKFKFLKHTVQTETKIKTVFSIKEKIEQYMYHNKVNLNKDLIGVLIGKKGRNIKIIINKVKCVVYSSDFEYYIDKTIATNKQCIYILANNKNILTVATNELNNNIAIICNTYNKK